MKKILLTGSSGFLGSVALKELSKNNIVYFISRKKIPNSKIKKNTKQIYYKDYKQLDLKLKKIKIDIVIHCATHYAKKHNKYDIEKFSDSNLIFGNILLENLKKMSVKSFINFSTVWENYNGINDNFYNLYSVYKRNFSNLILYYKKLNSKINFFNLFLSDTFGEFDKRPKIINILKTNYKENKVSKIISSKLFINLINVIDIIYAIEIILRNNIKPGDYNLINPKDISLYELVKKFNSKNKKKLKIKWLSKKIIKDKIFKKKILRNWIPKNSNINNIIDTIRR